MSPIPVNLVIEDELSEIVLRALLDHVNREYFVGTAYGRKGFGYLRSTITGWNEGARGTPFVLLTDLDCNVCAPTLIREWLRVPIHPNLLFRVAVREVEAWLLADRGNIARFLSVSEARVPVVCDGLADPKRELIELARKSRSRDIRQRLVPKRGSTAKQGPDYNGCLGAFVKHHWNINIAAISSPSLARTLHRLMTFAPTWPAVNPV
jgi:hypothetical protein